MLTNPAHTLGGASHKQEQQIDEISHVYLLFMCSNYQKVHPADIYVPVTERVFQYTEEPAPANGDHHCRSSHLVDAPQAGLILKRRAGASEVPSAVRHDPRHISSDYYRPEPVFQAGKDWYIPSGNRLVCTPDSLAYAILHQLHQAPCLLYTSDAADDLLCVDLGGRR